MINSPFNRLSEESSRNFASGLVIGILSTLLLFGLIGIFYYFYNKNNKSNNLMEDPPTNRGMYAEMELPSSYKAPAQ